MDKGIIQYGDQVVISLELKGIQAEVKKAIMARAEGITALVDQKVDEFFSQDSLVDAVEYAIKQEWEHSMRYGEGSRIVREFVAKKMATALKKLM